MKTLSKKLSVVVLSVLMTFCLFVSAATAVHAEEADGPVKVYSEDGTLIATFDSMDELLEHYASIPAPCGNVCDGAGHVHGSAVDAGYVVKPDGHTYYLVTCRWCGGIIEFYQVS